MRGGTLQSSFACFIGCSARQCAGPDIVNPSRDWVTLGLPFLGGRHWLIFIANDTRIKEKSG